MPTKIGEELLKFQKLPRGKIIEFLPDDQKEVLIYRYYNDLSFKEISEKTGVSINTSLGRMRYALNNLRNIIKKKKKMVEVDKATGH